MLGRKLAALGQKEERTHQEGSPTLILLQEQDYKHGQG